MAAPPRPSINNAGFQVGGVGVPGAQVELLESMQPEQNVLEQAQSYQPQPQQQQPQQQQQFYQQPQQQQQQQQYYQQPQQFEQQHQQSFFTQPDMAETPATAIADQQPRQFDQKYQQSFYTQPNMAETPATAITSQQQMARPTAVPLNTNAIGDGFPGYSVGGVGVPGAKIELMPLAQPEQNSAPGGQLGSVQHASASRPPVGPFDPPTPTVTAAPIPVHQPETFPQGAGQPMIQVERQPSMPHQQQQQQQPQQPQQQQQQAGQQSLGNTPISASSVSPDVSPKVHIASDSAIAAAAAAHAADASTRGRRRSSLAVLADKFRAASRSRSPSLSRRLSRTISRHSMDEADEEGASPYADVKTAQKEHLAKVRASQAKNNITTNVDGLPIPPPPEAQRRRSSVGHILGLDKPWLSR